MDGGIVFMSCVWVHHTDTLSGSTEEWGNLVCETLLVPCSNVSSYFCTKLCVRVGVWVHVLFSEHHHLTVSSELPCS